METNPSLGRADSETSVAGVETAWGDLRALMGAEHMRLSSAHDTVDGVTPQMVVEPGTPEEVAAVLKIAKIAGLPVIPRGCGSKLDWGNPPRNADLILSMRRLNRVVEHAWGDMTVTVEAGCTFQQLQETLAEHGQRLALDPLWPERATVGGILATNDSGPLRIRFGSLRDLVIGVTLALPDGTLAKSGGKVVKNVAGYDLPKLATGAFGTLGVITQAIFRLHPVPKETRTLSFSISDNEGVHALLLAIHDCNMVPTGVQVRAGSSAMPAIDLRFEGTQTGCEAQIAQTMTMASAAQRIDSPADVWQSHLEVWNGAEASVVCKFTFLPADLGSLLDEIKSELTKVGSTWRVVAQTVGVGYLRIESRGIESQDRASLRPLFQDLRKKLETRGGSLVLLRCPLEIKTKIDVWGTAGDTLPLMKSIKAQFDPTGILNPGRFLGGI